MVFTDEFATYMCIRSLWFKHDTVCHKHEFCHFMIEGSDIIRVCTNHVVRLWVELEKTLAHMTLEKTLQCLNLESYRQLGIYGTNKANLVLLLRDLAEVWQTVVARRLQAVEAAVQAE